MREDHIDWQPRMQLIGNVHQTGTQHLGSGVTGGCPHPRQFTEIKRQDQTIKRLASAVRFQPGQQMSPQVGILLILVFRPPSRLE
ncbi:hypothetical protein D3C79_899940 [compost metagenome]